MRFSSPDRHRIGSGALLGAKSIQLVITASDGAAQIDDVYVDPFVQR